MPSAILKPSRAGPAYDDDVYAWAAVQAALLRAGRLAEADIANIAEELDDVGKSQRLALASHVATVIEHLMKLQASPAIEPRAGWRSTIRRSRHRIEKLLQASPSLRRELPSIVNEETEPARQLAAASLADHGEPADQLPGLVYDESQVLGSWMPD
ncbi:MAG: DUF29 domain-containing protein [Acetobacteraceae bacterium]|nr:DUF29 domain-containing protein [Acetobacteraceae bacterium]MBV8523074.1 DUF29 domain-containing protein [Acetobacteraceae bacterium]